MYLKGQPCGIVGLILLFTTIFFILKVVSGGHFQKQRVTKVLNDPNWQKLIMWSNETMGKKSLLPEASQNQSHSKFINAQQEADNATLQQLELLKVNHFNLVQNLERILNDTSKSDEDRFKIIDSISNELRNMKQLAEKTESCKIKAVVQCALCQAAVFTLSSAARLGMPVNIIIKISYVICLIIQTSRVCDGITKSFAPGIVYVLKRTSTSPQGVCSLIMGDMCGDVPPLHQWEVELPPVQTPNVSKVASVEVSQKLLKVLQLSDTHFDPYYEEGANANCKEPQCCRPDSGPVKNPEDGAGRWGDYRKCDTPKRTIDHMFQHISSTHPDVDYILWTGDLPAHDIWNQTREGNLNTLKLCVAQMKSHFPKIPIFPALGNHESVPVNSFPPPFIDNEYSIKWLYDELEEQWKQWLPYPSASKTIRHGAFYSVLPRPGFRIISLNTNYCNNLNWWLWLNSTDPAQELVWFIDELRKAEDNREKVFIISHIPPGHSECLTVWSRNYFAIVARFESTITGQFFGHTHFDEFKVFYDPKNIDRAVGLAYIGPSITPSEKLNPGYRIYYVDNSTTTVVDHETWVMDLEGANRNNTDNPTWYKLYSAKDAYQLRSLLPQDWSDLAVKFSENDKFFELYYKHYWKNSPVRPTCDTKCKQQIIHDLRSVHNQDDDFCDLAIANGIFNKMK